ncbi:MAG: bifunctional phosphoribosylaminoimidazolecarboxamide formyltransferase/inosine monophosphate cyclohydrolase [Bacteroidota bacterium]|nr:bifunctional phosphoribosylaminoimidazolecarboxamide formyltransferase/inosine monophosphate cyclohydrolase [Bacteroidota bacterium]
MKKKLTSALISVFNKDGLVPVIQQLKKNGINIYSTGGTQKFIEDLGIDVIPVEQLTTYPSILGGRVKTLHPSVFGGILGRRSNEIDRLEMKEYNIPEIDLVIVDLYPFEQTLEEAKLKTSSFEEGVEEAKIIEKIDIGGPSLIRAAAKNFNDVVVIASKENYEILTQLLVEQSGETTVEQRRTFAARAFELVAHYDVAIAKYFNPSEALYFLESITQPKPLRYGENPHQSAVFYGNLDKLFEQLNGKELSYNNLVDVNAAIELINDAHPNLPQGKETHAQPPLKQDPNKISTTTQSGDRELASPPLHSMERGPGGEVFAIIKHTNVCGMASRKTLTEAWLAALAGDRESAFGGVLICNSEMDKPTAEAINEIFFEVLIAPAFSEDAFKILSSKKNRILLRYKTQHSRQPPEIYRSLFNGVLIQGIDKGNFAEWEETGGRETTDGEKEDLKFANIICKHLKSNAIALVKNKQLIGKGCGQTSRIDALRHAIEKANQSNFTLEGAVMASDAFFPFADCVKLGHRAGISAFIQPGGSIREKESIDYCKENNLAMVLTGMRHFKH